MPNNKGKKKQSRIKVTKAFAAVESSHPVGIRFVRDMAHEHPVRVLDERDHQERERELKRLREVEVRYVANIHGVSEVRAREEMRRARTPSPKKGRR